ncbi:uncharacterized protein LOC111890549 [Lactuca sativa]|uniref:uncharacterized protein LOC111890549 n=1 Tax=Lactuca sativa TaxID=4236 RepID=UPI000CD9AB00|nr:uncharacterized protein LOC111890549 [Lactuca sativa]
MVDMKIMRVLCANGIPFNVLRNPQFQEMITTINKEPAGYKAPLYDKARTILLDECVRDMEKGFTSVRGTWYIQEVSIVSNGCSNVKHQPLNNVIVANNRGAMFIYADEFYGVEKTGATIADFLLGAIKTIGPSNVLQVVTGNAKNCKTTGKEVEKVYKHIFWSPCYVYFLNLSFKDLANECFWLMDTYRKGKIIVKHFLNHTHALAIFRDNSQLELLKVAKTRFASHYIFLKRLWDCRESLATTTVLYSWREWLKNGDENTRQNGLLVPDTIKSEDFWDDVKSVLAVTKPKYLMVKFCNGDGSKMGEIYEKMDNILREIKNVMMNHRYVEYYP